MATTVWVPWAASSGAMAAPYLSKEIYELAQYELQFDRFCDEEKAYGKGKGDDIYWAVDSDLTGAPTTFAGATLGETNLVPKYMWSQTRTHGLISEIGSGVSYTAKAAGLASIDIDARSRSRIKNQMVRVLDNGAATAFKTTDVKYSPTGAATGTWSLTGAAGAAVTSNLTAFHFREIQDYMYSTLRVEPYDNEGNYICITTRQGIRGLYDDPDYMDLAKRENVGNAMRGEVGRYYKFRIFETNDTNALSTKGAGAVCAEALFFGKDAVMKAVAKEPTITMETRDHGRFVDIAWVAWMGYFLKYDYTTVARASVVHIDST